jgi:hypothetical protein
MRPGTEDLLAVRDGEPLDASVKALIESSPVHGREVERLRRVGHALRALPALAPPEGVLARVLEAKDAREVGRSRWLRFAAGAGVVAAVAPAAIVYVATSGQPQQEPAPLLGTGVSSGPRISAAPISYGSLVEQSARLDRLLAELPAQRPLMTGATASTIAGLEDRIAFLDDQLTFSAADKLPAPQRAALWSDRVELMNALVSVRYAEAQANGF